jgi:DNA-binding transcriptional LysR family regulator
MDLHLVDLNLLVALDALLVECNVTQAGNRLNLSQPAMSGALARLRSHFQDELLVSVGRRMVRTPLADILVGPVRDILQKTRATLEARPSFDPATSTRLLSVAVSDYFTIVQLADVLRCVASQAPCMTVELRPLGRKADEALDSGELDFLIHPADYLLETHPSDVLFEDGYTCVVWSGHTAVGSTLSPEQYLSMGHVVFQPSAHRAVSHEEQYLRKAQHKRRVVVYSPSFCLLPELVVGTAHVATLHTRLALEYAKRLPLKLLPMPIEVPPLVEMLQWHRVRELDPAHQWFRRLLMETVRGLPLPARSRGSFAREIAKAP